MNSQQLKIENPPTLYYTNIYMVKCKRCLITDEILNVKIKDLLGIISPDDKAPDGLYLQRLDICLSCEYLNAGTCVQCGCFVELRAARSNRNCPINKWKPES